MMEPTDRGMDGRNHSYEDYGQRYDYRFIDGFYGVMLLALAKGDKRNFGRENSGFG
jgi:hypothetical protein